MDARVIIAIGLGLTALSLYEMSHFSLLMGMNSVVWTGLIQGLGTGIAYVPLAALAFATLPPLMRNEGTALFNLIRNIGSSVGISTVQGLMVHNTQVVHAALVEHITPRMLSGHLMGPFTGAKAAAAMNAAATAQATMIAYLDNYHLMLILTVVATFTLFFVRKPESGKPAENVVLE